LEIPWDWSSVALHIPIMCRTIDWPGPRVLEFTSCRWRAARVVEWRRLCEGWWPLSCNWSRDRPLVTDIVIATRFDDEVHYPMGGVEALVMGDSRRTGLRGLVAKRAS